MIDAQLGVRVMLLLLMAAYVESAIGSDCSVLNALGWQGADASWSGGMDCCSWSGVTCDASRQLIVGLSLSNRSLRGSLPAALVLLHNLRSIDLSHNALTGTLPMDWNASSLLILSFNHNSFSGQLPSAWGPAMPALQAVDISYNQLTGTVPSDWRHWTRLKSLVLSNNQLAGSLPAEYSSWTQLRLLDLTYNQFSGTLPSAWAAWSSMGYMSLSNNRLGGTLPPEWGNMSIVQFLGAESNRIVGSVPRSWCQFSSPYVAVNLGSNLLNALPLEIFADHTCRLGLMLGENLFAGPLPPRIDAPLVGLVLNHNKLSGALPLFNNAAVLDVSYNAITEFPCVAGAVSTIHVVGNPLQSLPDPQNGNCTMPNVTAIVASNCPLLSLPSAMDVMLPNLSTFVASNTVQDRLGQALPRFAQDKLTVLDLSRNNFATCSSQIRMAQDAVYVDLTEKTTAASCNSLVHASCSTGVCLSLTSGANDSCSLSNCLMRLNDRVAVNTSRYIFGQAPIGVLKMYFHSRPSLTSLDDVASFLFLFKYVSPKLNGTIVVDFYKFLTTEISVSFQPILVVRSSLPTWASQKVPTWNNSVVQMPPIPSSWLSFSSLDPTMLLHNVTYALEFLFVSDNSQVMFVDKRFVWAISPDFSARPCSAGLAGVPFTTVCAGCPALAFCNGTSAIATFSGWRPRADVLPLVQCKPTSKGCDAQGGDGTKCIAGYTGPLCSVCLPDYGSSGNGKCSSCLPFGLNIVLVVIAGLVGLLLVTVAVYRSTMSERDDIPLELSVSRTHVSDTVSRWTLARRRAWLLIKLVMNHFSLASPLAATIAAQSLSESAFFIVKAQGEASGPSLVQFNFVSCLVPDLTANGQLVGVLIIVGPLVILEHAVVKRIAEFADDEPDDSSASLSVTVAAVAACVLQLFYMAIVTSAASVLQYDEFVFYNQTAFLLDSEHLTQPLAYLRPMTNDRRLDYASNTSYYILGWCSLVIIGIGVPSLFVMYYVQLRRKDPTLVLAQEQLCFLVKNFRPTVWYWEAVIMLRKVVSLAVVASLRSFPVAQVQAYILVIAVYLAWHSHASPNLTRNAALVEGVSCMSAIATANVLLFTTASSNWMTSSGPSIVILVVQIVSLVAIVFGSLMEAKSNSGAMKSGRSFVRMSPRGGLPSSPLPPTTRAALAEQHRPDVAGSDYCDDIAAQAELGFNDGQAESPPDFQDQVRKLTLECARLQAALAAAENSKNPQQGRDARR